MSQEQGRRAATGTSESEHEDLLPIRVFLERAPLAHGIIYADLGCGGGHFTLPVARLLRGSGTVFAVGTSQEALDGLRLRLEEEMLTGWVIPVLAEPGRIPLPDASVDLANMANLLHRLTQPEAFLAEVLRVLRPQGKLLLLDWRELPANSLLPDHGPTAGARTGEQKARLLLQGAGFEWAGTWGDVFPEHYVLGFRKPAEMRVKRSTAVEPAVDPDGDAS